MNRQVMFDGTGIPIAKDPSFYERLMKRRMDNMLGNEIEYRVVGQDIINRLTERAEKANATAKGLEVDGVPPTSACDRGLYELARKDAELSHLRAKYLQAGEYYMLSGGMLADIFIEQERYAQYADVERGPSKAMTEAKW